MRDTVIGTILSTHSSTQAIRRRVLFPAHIIQQRWHDARGEEEGEFRSGKEYAKRREGWAERWQELIKGSACASDGA